MNPLFNGYFDVPKGRTKMIVQSNKINHAITAILGYCDVSTLNNEFYNYVEVTYDPDTEVIQGKYPDYTVAKIADLPETIYESSLNALARDKIVKEYPLVRQLNMLCDAIKKLGDEHNIQFPDIQEMQDYINEVRDANNKRKEFYKASPDFNYVDSETEEAEMAARHEGGLSEVYGNAPLSTATSIFGK